MDYRRIAALTLALVAAISTSAAAGSTTRMSVSSSVASEATLSGSLSWTATVGGVSAVRSVAFKVDGATVATDSAAPFSYTLDTTTLANGAHTLSIAALSSSGKTATWSGAVTVSNVVAVKPSLSGSIAAPAGTTTDGQTLTASSGSWTGTAPISFAYAWQRCDTTGAACAPISGATASTYPLVTADVGHTIRVAVTASNKAGAASATSAATIGIAAAVSQTSYTVASSIPNGATLSGSLAWSATTAGATTLNVKFSIDGVLKTTEQWAPYFLNGDNGVLNTTTLADGKHTLSVTATATDGRTVTATMTVTVANAAPAPAPTPTPTPPAPTPTPTPPASSFQSFVGIDSYKTTDFAAMASLGITHTRMDNPSAATIDTARAAGITVLPIADYEPWSDLNGGAGDKTPPLPQYYATWAQRMVNQWKSMANPPQVFEVWNEPWLSSFWAPGPDAAAYLQLVKAFAQAAWAVWPNATILVSADTMGTNSYPWRAKLIAADTTGFLNDARIKPTSHNYVEGRTPTQVTSSPCSWDLDRYKCAYNDFKAHGNPNPQVWVTEFGWESDVVGEANQAAYTKQAFQSFKSSGMVAAAFTFFLKSSDTWSYNWLRTDNTKKPVAGTIQQLIANGS
jgi:hypothetical protein